MTFLPVVDQIMRSGFDVLCVIIIHFSRMILLKITSSEIHRNVFLYSKYCKDRAKNTLFT